eukprot:175113_1
MSLIICLAIFLNTNYVQSLNNGLALTPPMGWLSWQRFRCTTNCTLYPNNCINDKLYMTMADYLVSDGWLDVGYNHVNIDSCWMTTERDNITNKMVPDPIRFPNGISGVADYIHSKGLKLGFYSDIGNRTCNNKYQTMGDNYELDANTFVSWKIDMFKLDGCHETLSNMYLDYPTFGKYLNATNRSVIYSCSWPAYISGHGETVPIVYNTTLSAIAKTCNLWRNFHDIGDSFDSVNSIVKYWRRNYHNYSIDPLLSIAGPGQWNDPDQIIIGDNGLSISESETQFALWSVFAAPLLMSNDLRSIDVEFKTLLQNKEIIDVNQDPMGKQGGVIHVGSKQAVYMRELSSNNSIAIVFQNNGTAGFGTFMTFTPSMVPTFVNGWSKNAAFTARNLLNHTDLGTFNAKFVDLIEPSSVGMYKLTPVV